MIKIELLLFFVKFLTDTISITNMTNNESAYISSLLRIETYICNIEKYLKELVVNKSNLNEPDSMISSRKPTNYFAQILNQLHEKDLEETSGLKKQKEFYITQEKFLKITKDLEELAKLEKQKEFSSKKFFKITNEQENHYGFQYKDGLNILDKPFEKIGSCVPGGLYFTDAKHIFDFLEYGVYLREVFLPFEDDDFEYVKDGDKWRANKIILGKKYELCKVETFEYLVELGACLYKGRSIIWAIEKGYLEVIKYLVELGGDVKVKDDYAIRYASRHGHLEVVKYLTESEANIKIYNNYPVRHASKKNHTEIVKYLVTKGANIKICNGQLLRLASKRGQLDLIKFLVANGGDIHVLNDYTVRWAARHGHLDVVKYLVSISANIRACDDYAIKQAANYEHLEMVKYLVSLGCDHRATVDIIKKRQNETAKYLFGLEKTNIN